MSTYQPDGKTLLRHAMAAFDDEFGVNEAWQFNERLLAVFQDVVKHEVRALGLNISVSRPRTASVDHHRDLIAGIHVVDGGGPA